MPDMEKVKKALEYCDNSEDCQGCVYWEESLHINDCPVNRYALELLKEQEAEIEQLNRFINGFSRDAIPVVRCKDCKYRFVDGDNVRFNMCLLNHNKLQPDDWFCADGEQRG